MKPDEAGVQIDAQLAAERQEHQRLRSELDLRNCALDSASTYFMILGVSRSAWTIVYANLAIAKDHGYEPAELLGQNPAMLASAEDNKVAFGRLSKAAQDGRSVRTKLMSHRRDGSTFWIDALITPVPHSGGDMVHYLAIGADITARLEQERAQRRLKEQLVSEMQERERIGIELRVAQKLESMGRLAVGIAHEINTPIQYVGDSVSFLRTAQTDLHRLLTLYRTTFQQLARNDSPQAILARLERAEQGIDLAFLSTEMPRAFQRTLEGVERVATIVRAMKEFAHPDSVEQNPADLNHAIETTLLVAHNEYKYNAQVESRLGELPQVICNVGELNQVFLNLIVNAAHAIAESGKGVETGRITITTQASGDSVVICVEDNGCGISEENLGKIFDPFFTTKPVGRGTGQGLAITRIIITEKHGGTVDVHSAVGSGTRFVLRLPIAGRPRR
jgi:PAS domain S-box-containing protein